MILRVWHPNVNHEQYPHSMYGRKIKMLQKKDAKFTIGLIRDPRDKAKSIYYHSNTPSSLFCVWRLLGFFLQGQIALVVAQRRKVVTSLLYSLRTLKPSGKGRYSQGISAVKLTIRCRRPMQTFTLPILPFLWSAPNLFYLGNCGKWSK